MFTLSANDLLTALADNYRQRYEEELWYYFLNCQIFLCVCFNPACDTRQQPFIILLSGDKVVHDASRQMLELWKLNLSFKQDEPRPVVDQPAGDQTPQSVSLSSSPVPLLPPVFTSTPALAGSPEADGKPVIPEENGEMEPMRNGAGHTSETESSDSGATHGDKENSTGAPQDMEG